MQSVSYYQFPLSNLLLSVDDIDLNRLWFDGQKYFAKFLDKQLQEKETSLLKQVKTWLELYFSGTELNFKIPLHFVGTEFQKQVWEILCKIPYGQTITYGEITKQIAPKRGLVRMSAQAIGRNKIAIIVPCHRVIGANGNLT